MEARLPEVIEIICEVGGVRALDPDQDFYEAGVSSVQSLPLLIQMEDRFGVSIPDQRFTEIRTARQLSLLIAELPKA
jgi:acyl carrier protein